MTDRNSRTSPLAVLGDGILLLCAMAGLTLSFLSLYGDEVLGRAGAFRATPLDLCAAQAGSFLGLAVLFALAALCLWSLPRFRGAAVGGAAALWTLLAFSRREDALRGAGAAVRTITGLFAQRVSWGRTFPYESGLTPAAEGAAARLFLTLALALLALALGWAVVRAKRWWLVVVLTLPPLLPGLLADLYPHWPPFMALALCWCAMLLTDLCKWAAPDRRGLLTLAVLPCVAVVLTAVTLFFPREGYTRPVWALRAEARLSGAGDRLSDLFSRFDGPFRSTVTYVGSAEEADLAHAGPLDYSGRTALRVRSDYEGRLYLRGSSLAGYEDGVWKAMPDEIFQETARQQTGLTPRVLFFPAMSTDEHGPEHTVTVDNVGAVGSCVYAPYFLTVQELEDNGMTMVNDSLLARRQGWWTHTLSFVELPEPHPGELTGVGTVILTSGQNGADFGRYPQFVYERYLDVPAEIRKDLAQDCMAHGIYGATLDGGGPADPADTARQIAALLDELCEYDQLAPAAPEGMDPVLYFLTESRRGYCMHFASAATLMLRSLGIPARYVSGFTVESVPDRDVTVPDRAAHAWVEVWVSGFGWYPVEVTPAAAFEWYEQGAGAPADLPSLPVPESAPPEPTPTPAQAPEPSRAPGEARPAEADGPEAGPGPDWLTGALTALAAAAGIAALLWLWQLLVKSFRARRLSSPDHDRAALYGYRCLERMERWGGRMDERAVELAQKAKFSRDGLTAQEAAELRSLVDLERERLCIILGPAERLLFRWLWGMPHRPKMGEDSENDRENGA